MPSLLYEKLLNDCIINKDGTLVIPTDNCVQTSTSQSVTAKTNVTLNATPSVKDRSTLDILKRNFGLPLAI
jgi:hypothetical protein